MAIQLAPLLLGLSNGIALRSPCSVASRRRPVCMKTDGRPSLWEAYSASRGKGLGLPLSSPQPSPPPPQQQQQLQQPPPCPPPPWSPPPSSATSAAGEATRDSEVDVTQFQVEVTPEAEARLKAAVADRSQWWLGDHAPPPWSPLGPPPPAAAPSSPPAALSLAEMLWSVERESEIKAERNGAEINGAPVTPRSSWAPTGANLRPELWMGTPAAPVTESDPSAPLSCDPSRLTPMQRRLKDVLEEISRPIEMDAERPVMFAQGQSRLCADDPGFDFERWRLHTSPSRYIRLLGGSIFGVTFRRVVPAVVVLALISWLSCIYENAAFNDPTLLQIRLPILLFELTAPALTLLLVFRSDNSYSRFKDGSVYLWEITTSIRSYIRRLVGWTSSSRTTADERVATEQIILACCLLHQWIMNEYLRDNGPMHEQLHGRKVHEDLLCAALGVASSSEIIDGQDTPTPYLGLTAIILGATKRLPSLTDQERVGLEDELGDVASNLGQCERLLRQPIPLGYERSTIRFLWMWLLLLPFALVPTFADMNWPQETWSSLVVGSVTFLGIVFLCVEDIAVQIEQPFGILPLDLCHNWLMKDVARTRRLLSWSSYERGDSPPS